MNNNTPANVWLIIDSLTFGGIESHVIELAKGLMQFNVHVKVWLVREYSTSSPLCERLDQYNIPYGYLSHKRMRALPTLLSLIKKEHPTAIHAHGYKASLLTKLARLFTGVRQISTYHAGETPKGIVRLYDLLDRYSAKFSCATIAVSQPIQNKLPTVSQIFNNFVNTNEVSTSTGTQTAFVGRLSQEKAADRFIALACMMPELTFDIYGTGPEEQSLRAIATPNVIFHGHQTNMASVWANINILIICSRFEGLPMAALEAMARGTIILALNVGNLDRLIVHKHNGYIFDDFESLCQFYYKYTDIPQTELNQIRKNARNTIEASYSQQAVIPKLLELYQN